MKSANAYSADCPTRQILDRVGDKWAVLILLLLRNEPLRFNQLRRAIEGISQKMLSQVLKSLERDVASLNDYEAQLTGKTHFLLDATLGLTNIEQNNIFRILTVVSVIGIPPTFFASLWGMNFKNMPELEWTYGYEFSLLVIAVSALIPIIWFKRSGWY